MTELHEAVADKDLRRVRRLLKAGADVNAPDEDDATPLHYAAAEGDIRIIRLLLEAGADRSRVDSSGQPAWHWAVGATRSGSEALFLLMGIDACPVQGHGSVGPPEPSAVEQAIRAGNLDLLASLLGEGAGETSEDEFSNPPICTAVLAGRPEVVRYLIERGADVNRKDEDGRTLLHLAADCGQLEVVRTLLDLGAQVNLPGGRDPNLTPLQIACREGHTAVAKLLLQRGVDPELTEDFDGWTALHHAAFRNRPRIIRLLLKHGADLHARSDIYDMSRTALELAVGFRRRRAAKLLYSVSAKQDRNAYGSPLHAAANVGDAALVQALIEAGADVNAVDYELKTPLHRAVGERRPLLADLILEYHKVQRISPAVSLSQEETVKVLLRSGADLEARNAYGSTPLLEAGQWGQDAAARLLIQAGVDVNARDEAEWAPVLLARSIDTLELLLARGADLEVTRRGWDALGYASNRGDVEMVKFLIRRGLKANRPGGRGYTALHAAALLGHREIVALLLARGADPASRDEHGRTPRDLAKQGKHMAIVRMLTRRALSPGE